MPLPWLLPVAAALAPMLIDKIGGAFEGESDEDEARRALEEQRAAFQRRQGYDRNVRGWEQTTAQADRGVQMGEILGGGRPSPLVYDPYAFGLEGENKLFAEGQDIESDEFDARQKGQKAQIDAADEARNGWRSWLGPLAGAGIAGLGAQLAANSEAKKNEPFVNRRNALNAAVDEGDWLRSQGNTSTTAWEENRERMAQPFKGPRSRMTQYDF